MRITKDDVTYTLSRIGVDALGIDGSDEYLLVKADDEVTIEQVQELVAELFYRDTTHAGGYYCHTTDVAELYGRFIALVQHRFDV